MVIWIFILRIINFHIIRTIRLINFLNYNIEYLKINVFLKREKIFNLVYDLKCQSLAIGNFAIQLFLARYFSLKKKKIRIFIINDVIRSDHDFRLDEKKKIYYDQFIQLTNLYVQKNLLEIKICSFQEFIEIISEKNFYKNNYIFERKRVLSRFKTETGYLLNKLTINENINFVKRYLLAKEDFFNYCSKKVLNFQKKKYISLVVRYDPNISNGLNNSLSRNIKKNSLIKTINLIKKKFSGYNIFIVSDNLGCLKAKYFLKHYLRNSNINILFSKDYTSSIIEDIFLTINSKCVINYLAAGGTTEFVRISTTPFFGTYFMSVILMLKKQHMYDIFNKVYWWNGSHNSQVIVNSYKFKDFEIGLKKYQFNYNQKYNYSKN